MSYEEFLHSTPPEINIKVEAYNDAKDELIAHNWQLGQLVAIAVNNPKEYPRLETLLPKPKKPEPKPLTDSDARRDIIEMVP